MMQSKNFDEIPRGNTCPGVNRAIIEHLAALDDGFDGKVFLDVPCGEGEFLQTVKEFFPQCQTIGADISLPIKDFDGFRQIDARQAASFRIETKAQVITCISGLMEFDNTTAFFEMLRANLNEDGVFIVTNDNFLSVRDRFLYLLFGRVRHYHLFIRHDQPTWKIVSLQNLLRILSESGFETIKIEYIPVKTVEWLWLPVASLIYIFQSLYMRFAETEIAYDERIARYPFLSLLSRHYIIVCRLKR